MPTPPPADQPANRNRSGASPGNAPPKRVGQSLFLGFASLGILALVVHFVFFQSDSTGQVRGGTSRRSTLTLKQIPFDGGAAYQWVKHVCALGPRVSGTDGMRKQQQLLVAHFKKLGGQVELQKFSARHPLNGKPVAMANLIVRWHPERKNRILLCAHYDTRPFPDQDPRNPRGRFVGANDGGSGVGVLAVMGQYMPKLEGNVGVDFVLFDGEELVYNDRGFNKDPYFLGSEHFAVNYAADRQRPYRYHAAVLLDMVGDRYLDLYQERNSLRWSDSRWIVESIWKKAAELGVREFIPRPLDRDILDDHIMLHDKGKIPSIDIIDFRYRSRDGRRNLWHTTQDVPENCSPLSLAKVGWVVHEWLKDQSKREFE